MSGLRLSDEEIAAMTVEERRELILRLAPVPARLRLTTRTLDRLRKWRTIGMLACAAAMIPWTIYLAKTLPSHYVARHWVATWVGFDIFLLCMLIATAIAGWRRRQLVFPTAFATGILLICDAWFDIMTSQPGSDLMQALISAAVLELPLAFVMIAGPLRLMRFVAVRHGLIPPGTRMWRVPIPMPELWQDGKIPPC
ncbi:hypothetical protein [Kribbella sp. NPDC006257]|uniref:hypothetical protein n=1 Tax=Kribbella sp. NPDC006257 TaxID=3156738 RepID=UPI0033B4E74A